MGAGSAPVEVLPMDVAAADPGGPEPAYEGADHGPRTTQKNRELAGVAGPGRATHRVGGQVPAGRAVVQVHVEIVVGRGDGGDLRGERRRSVGAVGEVDAG